MDKCSKMKAKILTKYLGLFLDWRFIYFDFDYN